MSWEFFRLHQFAAGTFSYQKIIGVFAILGSTESPFVSFRKMWEAPSNTATSLKKKVGRDTENHSLFHQIIAIYFGSLALKFQGCKRLCYMFMLPDT